MKKKLFSNIFKGILTVVIMAAFLFLALGSGLKLNKEREAHQIIASVSKYDMTLNVSQSEMMDYINSNASSLIQNYGYTVEEAIRYLADRKVDTKLLTIEGIKYLKDLSAAGVSKRKADVLVSGTGTIADGVLTLGEYYDAIKSVNESIKTTIDGYVKEYELVQKKKEINLASTKDIEKIEIIEGLKKEYLVGDTLDSGILRIKITYLKDSQGNGAEDRIIPITDAMITTAFDSTKVAEKLKLVITFTANNKDADGKYAAVDMTAEGEYEVKVAPTTRTKVEDEKEDTVIERYSDKATITAGYKEKGLPEKLDIDAKISSSLDADKDAYRRLKSSLSSAFRDMDYFYNNAFENQVLSALQWELQQTVLSEKDDAFWNAEIAKQFDYLASSSMVGYDLMTAKAQKEAFITAIGSALTSLYYIPNIENLQDYAWVSQILFSFTDAQKKVLGSNPTDAAYKNMMSHMTVDEANPKYEPNHEHDKDSVKCEEGCDKDTPYLSYGKYVFKDTKGSDGAVTLSVYSQLCLDLNAAVTAGQDPLKVFEDYLYRYNSDSGIFNNDLGYLITPKNETTSWVEGFAKIGRQLIQDSKNGGETPNAGYYQHFGEDKLNPLKINVGGQDVPEVTYCFSTYGIHLMMVKYTPFNEVYLNKETYAYGKGFRFTADTKLTDINRETGAASKITFGKTLKDNVKTEIKTKAYNDFIEKYITEENKKAPGTSINLNSKKMDELVKKYSK